MTDTKAPSDESTVAAAAPPASAPAAAPAATETEPKAVKDMPALVKQLAFYFSDSNYPRDKFMRQLAAKDPEGFIPVDTFLIFSRVTTMTNRKEDIVAALKQVSNVTLNSDETKVKRTTAIPEDDVTTPRSIYVKGLPTEGITIDSVSTAFAKHGEVLSVRIRRYHNNKQPKGSAFIEFSSPEVAKKVLEVKPTYDDKELICMMKADYIEIKKAEAKNKDKDGAGKKRKAKEEEEEEKEQYEKDCIVHLTGVPEDDTTIDRPLISQILNPFGKCNYIGYNNGDQEVFLRCPSANDAKAICEGIKQEREIQMKKKADAEGSGDLKGNPDLSEEAVGLIVRINEPKLLEGDAEKEFWEKAKAHWSSKGKGKGKKGRGRPAKRQK